jgi:hypothetical protein
MNRSLIAAATLFAAITFASRAAVNAQADVEGPDCTGTVVSFQHSVTLDPHGDEVCSPKWITDRKSKFAKQILKKCPFGSHCHIEGVYSNHGIEEITKVERVR